MIFLQTKIFWIFETVILIWIYLRLKKAKKNIADKESQELYKIYSPDQLKILKKQKRGIKDETGFYY